MRGLWSDDYINARIGTRTILGRVHCPHGKVRVKFICDCGEKGAAPLSTILKKPDRKCRACVRARQGLSTTPLYRQWIHMRRDGRVTLAWHDWDVFLAAVGGPHSTGMRLTRPDVTKVYGPDNFKLEGVSW